MDYQRLFNYMSEEHGVTLLEQDMQEIIIIVNEMQAQDCPQPVANRTVDGSNALLSTVFVYAKDGKIKALNIEEAKRLQDELTKNGWVHTKTLDACAYIQYLHNDCKEADLIDEMKNLTKRPS